MNVEDVDEQRRWSSPCRWNRANRALPQGSHRRTASKVAGQSAGSSNWAASWTGRSWTRHVVRCVELAVRTSTADKDAAVVACNSKRRPPRIRCPVVPLKMTGAFEVFHGWAVARVGSDVGLRCGVHNTQVNRYHSAARRTGVWTQEGA